MKKIIIIFLLFSSLSFSYTRKEQIQENLSKVGIKQEIIDETQKMDFEIRDLVTFENNENVIGEKLNRLLALLKKDERNYIVSEDIITIYESKIGKDYEKYLNLFTKYTPYDYEKLFAKMVYYRGIGEKDKSDSYYREIEKKYSNTPIMEVIKIYNTANEKDRLLQIKKVLDILKNEEIKRQKGEYREKTENVEIILKEKGFIPENYIEKEERLNIYKRFAILEDFRELNDLVSEIEDRFGKIPQEMKKFIINIKFKIFAEMNSIQTIEERKNTYRFSFVENVSEEIMSELEKHLEMKEIVQVPIFEENKKEMAGERFIIKEIDKKEFLEYLNNR